MGLPLLRMHVNVRNFCATGSQQHPAKAVVRWGAGRRRGSPAPPDGHGFGGVAPASEVSKKIPLVQNLTCIGSPENFAFFK